jgi:hypothetical protein
VLGQLNAASLHLAEPGGSGMCTHILIPTDGPELAAMRVDCSLGLIASDPRKEGQWHHVPLS